MAGILDIPLYTLWNQERLSKIWAMSLQKLWKSSFLVKWNLPCRFTNKETHFISFKDLSCIWRSKPIFRQYLKFHAFSILATQLTRWVVRIQNFRNFSRALTQNGLNISVYYYYSYCQSIVTDKNRSSHKDVFCKKLVLLLLVNHEKVLVVSS